MRTVVISHLEVYVISVQYMYTIQRPLGLSCHQLPGNA